MLSRVPKIQPRLDRFILDGIKEAKVPGLAAVGGKEGQSALDGSLRMGQPRAKDTRHQRDPVSGRLGLEARDSLRRDAVG